ncbi:MAG: hypothetical protein KR126chlam6_00902 [Candidatus Anoxychlamydiales bacterium]|nr:hypothetical protein [Candidatus Anoxychlamydiales bacterium]
MEDIFKDLSDCLNTIINLLKDFDLTKDDYKKPGIRANQIKMLSIAKIIGNKVLSDMEKLNSDIDEYLSNPEETIFKKLIHDAVNLQNDLWEL